ELVGLDGVFPHLGLASERHRSPSLVLGDLDGRELRPVHALERDQVTARVHHRDVELPVMLLRLRSRSGDGRLSALERYRSAIGDVEGHLVRHRIERVRRGGRLRRGRLLCDGQGSDKESQAENRSCGHGCLPSARRESTPSAPPATCPRPPPRGWTTRVTASEKSRHTCRTTGNSTNSRKSPPAWVRTATASPPASAMRSR